MNGDNWHRCPNGPEYVTVVLDGDTLKFVDEYEFEINYCPYCGKAKDGLEDVHDD